MAYDPALGTATDRIRLAVGDTDDADPLLPEPTYAALLAGFAAAPDPERRATIAAAEALIARFAREASAVDVAGTVKLAWADRLAAWRALANALRAEAGLATIGAAGADNTMRIGRLVRA